MHKRLLIIAVLFGLSLFLSPSPSAANVITVDGICTLADAIIAANTDTATGDCDAGTPGADTIVLNVDVSLTSVYPGSTTIGGGQSGLPDITSDITIQSGFQATIDANENNYRHLYVAPSGSLTLTNVTITGGHLNQPGGSAYGGAIYADGDLTLTDTEVLFNSVDGDTTRGGAIYIGADGNLTISGDSLIHFNFSNGTVLGDGGAIYAQGLIGSISAQGITNNTATTSGGAVYATTITTISSTEISGYAGESGGGIYANYIDSIDGSTFTESVATSGNGGGLALTNGFSTITNSIFSDLAAQYGGALWIESTNGSTGVIDNTDFGFNCSGQAGKNIWLGTNASVSITSSMFDEPNLCDLPLSTFEVAGGAIYSEGDLFVTNSTFESYSGIHGQNTGGAIHNENGTLVVEDSEFNELQVLGETLAAGGAIYSVGDLTVRRNTFFAVDALIDGEGVARGGAIYSIGQAEISENSFFATFASSYTSSPVHAGGAIYAEGQADIQNNIFKLAAVFAAGTVSEVASGSGGTIYLDAMQPSTILHNTFVDSISTNGEVLFAAGSVSVNGNIFASNGYDANPDYPDCTLVGVTGSNNLHLPGDTSCDSISSGTIELGVHINEGAGLLQSVFGNPAIDGNPGCGLAMDGLGNPRIGACDIGYHELQLSSPTPMFTPTDTLTPTPTSTPTMTTFTVNSLADTDDGTCDLSNCTLREAIAASNAAVGANTINFSVTGTILLASKLDVTGGVTINGSGITLDGNNATRIMYISSGITVTINDLIFQNGWGGSGGAIENLGTLIINNSTFNGNTIGGFGSGGAIYNRGTLEIVGSTFSDNSTASSGGGAIANSYYGTLTITDSTFSNNSSNSNGGAIDNRGDLVTITDSIFEGNSADYNGGAIDNSGGTLEIGSSIFDTNSASSGGAICNTFGTLNIIDSTFNGNFTVSSTGNGGAIDNLGTLNITSSTFSGNSANDGGAIASVFRAVTITGSTFNGNSASGSYASGGAIFNNDGITMITNSTFSANSASGSNSRGGAIYNIGNPVKVTSSTFSNNSAPTDGTMYNAHVFSSIIVGGACGSTFADAVNSLNFNAPGCPGTVADPQLGPLQNNGGPTDTMLPALNGPAVDAYAAPCATTTDQRGITRPQGSGCDIGATEQEGPVPTDTPVPPTDTPSGPTALVASAICVDENLAVTISSGDGPFNITASAGINTPVNGVDIGTHTINGPEKWDDLTVSETDGDMETTNLGTFRCRSDERPVPLSPAHRSRTTNPFPTFSWTGITGANNYRVFVFDDANPATRTVDIRQNSGGPTTMILGTPLPTGRLFWRVRARTNRVWSYWSIRFTLFIDPPSFQPAGVTPVPTIDSEQPLSTPVAPPPAPPTFPAPPNSR